MASMVTSDLEDSINISVFEQSSPDSLRSRARARAASPPVRNSSPSRSTSNYEVEDDYFGPILVNQCTSSRSSISSFPSSVIHNIPVTDNEETNFRNSSRSQLFSNGRNSPAYKASPNSYLSAFRHPNSVRALQLESEYADSDSYSVARSARPKRSPKISYFSPRSPGSTQSSPTKRSSRPGTPQHQRSSSKLKKEFPLVLLHCTLLPPATTTRGSSVSQEILEAVLPEDYRKRWRTLQDKVVKNTEVKQRGVLIAHPRDDYDLLEERLLEALELERPRIRKGHYIGTSKSDSDSGFESSSQNGTDDGLETEEHDDQNVKDKCPDCGTAVSCKIEQDRRWEIKIFAANGLMRSGAWSAAWEQMEKIDVEVAVWMPEDVRFEVEERLKALQAMEEAERPTEESINSPKKKKKRTRSNTARQRHDERLREIYGESEKPRTQEEIDGLAEPKGKEHTSAPTQPPDAQENMEKETQHFPPQPDFVQVQFQQHAAPPQPDFFTFMRHHFRTIVNDQRNLAIVLLSTLVLFFSVQNLDMSKKPTSQQSGAVDSTSAATDSTVDVSVISAEMPMISLVTTTVLATPSSFPSIAPLAEESSYSDGVLLVDDYTLILGHMSHDSFISSTVAELTTETSMVEPSQQTPETKEPVDIETVLETADLPDPSKNIDLNDQALPEGVAPSQQESNGGVFLEMASLRDIYTYPDEGIDTLTSSDDAEPFQSLPPRHHPKDTVSSTSSNDPSQLLSPDNICTDISPEQEQPAPE